MLGKFKARRLQTSEAVLKEAKELMLRVEVDQVIVRIRIVKSTEGDDDF